ncbi:MAG: putative glycolipid-binding domain-containing protein [bacterium]|nr:putative glycolipid-binding domain-containing protein [bacterium]
MIIDTLWQTQTEPGLEHLSLEVHDAGVTADGLLIGLAAARPFRLRYVLHLDVQFQVRMVQLAITEPFTRQIELRRDAAGGWVDKLGIELPALRGCRDVDIESSAFTNTLPIRRTAWKPGQTAAFDMAYIRLPDLAVEVDSQQYTCLDVTPDGGVFRYEGLRTRFSAELRVDAYGLVVEYGDLFRRVFSTAL